MTCLALGWSTLHGSNQLQQLQNLVLRHSLLRFRNKITEETEIDEQHSNVGVVALKVCEDWVEDSEDGILNIGLFIVYTGKINPDIADWHICKCYGCMYAKYHLKQIHIHREVKTHYFKQFAGYFFRQFMEETSTWEKSSHSVPRLTIKREKMNAFLFTLISVFCVGNACH